MARLLSTAERRAIIRMLLDVQPASPTSPLRWPSSAGRRQRGLESAMSDLMRLGSTELLG